MEKLQQKRAINAGMIGLPIRLTSSRRLDEFGNRYAAAFLSADVLIQLYCTRVPPENCDAQDFLRILHRTGH